MQYNWKYRRYKCKRRTSEIFDDVVPKKVKVRFNPLFWYPYTDTRTPFREVTLLPFEAPPELTAFLRSLGSTPTRPKFIWGQFKQSIFENWMHDKIHVIGASSGYDSRLIAKAVRELYREHGKDWLGETYFVECAGESEGFKEIMKSLKWTKNSIIWIPKFDVEYFKNIHKRFNGLCAYPMNQWWDFYKMIFDENEIQYISGFGGNVADVMNPNSQYMGKGKLKHDINGRLMMYFRYHYFYQISAFRQPKHSFHPFWSWRYIQATAGVEHKTDRTSVMLAALFAKECRHVKRMTILGDVTKNGHRHVNRKVMRELKDWYVSTDFGKRFPCETNKNIEYNRWWLQFCMANYVEANNISTH